MSTLYFTTDHEWIRVEDGIGTVGITDYAQQQLGDIVFVELPEAGRQAEKGGEIAVVESVKAASEVYAPVTGEIVEANAALVESPATVNESPGEDGWFFKIKIANPAELDEMMDQAAYDEFVAGLD